MRKRLQRAVVLAVAGALAVLVVPLGVAATAYLAAQSDQDLERAALEAAFRVGPTFTAGDPVELPRDGSPTIGLYTAAGRLVAGSGPAALEPAARRARSGTIVQTDAGGVRLTAVPVTASETVIGVVRAAETGPSAATAAVWLLLLGTTALIVAGSALLARRTAAQMAAPVERLAADARRMGGGRLAVPPASSGIAELDDAHTALVDAGARIADLVEREQRIASDASHQLRTPLAGLRAGIEVGLADPRADRGAVLTDALERIDRMDATITGLILLARHPDAAAATCDPVVVTEDRVAFWRPRLLADGRRLDLRIDDDPRDVAASSVAVATVLDVLLENALRHGAGDVEVALRRTDGVVTAEVEDGGRYSGPDDPFREGVSGAGGSGLGLALARRTATDAGGSLLLAETAPRTRFALLLREA